jgi:hypothetical protein
MTEPSDRELPFDVAPAVRALAGDQDLRLLAQMAAEPFECIACGQEGTASKTAASAVIIRAPKVIRGGSAVTVSPNRDLMLLRLAHRSCLPSQIIDTDEVMEPGEASVGVSTAMFVVRGMPQPVLLLDFVSGFAAQAETDGRVDLLVSSLLKAGMALVTDLWSPLPRAPGFSVRMRRGKVSVWAPDGRALLEESEVVRAPGWRKVVRDLGEVTVLAGSGLGLSVGTDGLAEAVRAGRVAGALIQVSN